MHFIVVLLKSLVSTDIKNVYIFDSQEAELSAECLQSTQECMQLPVRSLMSVYLWW